MSRLRHRSGLASDLPMQERPPDLQELSCQTEDLPDLPASSRRQPMSFRRKNVGKFSQSVPFRTPRMCRQVIADWGLKMHIS
jgi:hypothetical protein